jgi:molybdenum cofactor synthesis domain-containing protein
MEMHAFGHLTPVATARRRLLESVRPLSRTEEVAVELAFDRIAARSYRAPAPVPAFFRATWDGYAVRARDTRSATARDPVELRLVGEVFAEQSYAGPLRPGQAVAIATGGALPSGADSVAIFERVEERGNRIRLRAPVRAGDRIARPGEDFARGTPLVRTGERLSAPALASLAACGLPRVRVFARPVVSLLPNGNELVRPGARAGRGRIYESNNAALASVILAAGGVPRAHGPLPDDPRSIERAIRRSLRETDLVLATGGSSVGERDHLPRILPRLGKLLFHGIAVRPGKPTLAADVGGKLVIGMPGHPTSCLANMYWLVLPVLHRLGHRPGPGWTEGTAVLGTDALAPTPGMSTVVPLELRDGRAYSHFHGSSAITSLSGTTGYTILPPGRRAVRVGSRIRVCRLDPPLGSVGEERPPPRNR